MFWGQIANATDFFTFIDTGAWEADILGANVLPSGSSGAVNIADGRSQCAYDIRMVFDDGTDLVDQVNVCDLGSYTIQ